jgi:hypothetical protein
MVTSEAFRSGRVNTCVAEAKEPKNTSRSTISGWASAYTIAVGPAWDMASRFTGAPIAPTTAANSRALGSSPKSATVPRDRPVPYRSYRVRDT